MADTQTPTTDDTPSQDTQAEAKTFTQDELDKIVSERLERERKKYADYADLKKTAAEFERLRESQMTEQEKLQARLAELEKQLLDKELEAVEAQQRLMRARVAEQMGLPVALAERLTGTTEDELKTDAAKLQELLSAQTGGPPKASSKQGAPENRAPSATTVGDMIRRAAGY